MQFALGCRHSTTVVAEFPGWPPSSAIGSLKPSTNIVCGVGGDERPSIDSLSLCRGLFDVYLGDDPISDGGKRSLIAGFPALLGAALWTPGISRSASANLGESRLFGLATDMRIGQ